MGSLRLSLLLALLGSAAAGAAPVGMIGYTHGADYLQGYQAAAQQRGLEYDVLREDEIGDIALLSEYRAIVAVTGIGEQVGLPEEAREALVAYLAFGGSVVMEQHALDGIRDLPVSAHGVSKAEAMTVTEVAHPVTHGLSVGERLDYNGSASHLAVSPDAGVTVLAEIEGAPALIVAPVGRG